MFNVHINSSFHLKFVIAKVQAPMV